MTAVVAACAQAEAPREPAFYTVGWWPALDRILGRRSVDPTP